MAHQQPTDIDPNQVQNALNFWQGFMKFGKICTVVIIVVLLLMAAFLV